METTIITSLLCFLLGFSGGLAFYGKERIMSPLAKKGAKMKKETPKAYGAVKGAAKKTAKKATKKTSKKK
jgi:hypothetical protein